MTSERKSTLCQGYLTSNPSATIRGKAEVTSCSATLVPVLAFATAKRLSVFDSPLAPNRRCIFFQYTTPPMTLSKYNTVIAPRTIRFTDDFLVTADIPKAVR